MKNERGRQEIESLRQTTCLPGLNIYFIIKIPNTERKSAATDRTLSKIACAELLYDDNDFSLYSNRRDETIFEQLYKTAKTTVSSIYIE